MMVHVFNPSTDAEEGVLCEFVASLGYKASSQIGSKAAQRNSSLKSEKKRNEMKRKEITTWHNFKQNILKLAWTSRKFKLRPEFTLIWRVPDNI